MIRPDRPYTPLQDGVPGVHLPAIKSPVEEQQSQHRRSIVTNDIPSRIATKKIERGAGHEFAGRR